MDRKPEAHLEFRPLRFGGREAERRAGGGGDLHPKGLLYCLWSGTGNGCVSEPWAPRDPQSHREDTFHAGAACADGAAGRLPAAGARGGPAPVLHPVAR